MTVNGLIIEETKNDVYKLFKYRWFVLFVFCLYSAINFAQYLQYSIITNIISKYYGVETFTVSWSTLVFMIGYIVLFIPVSYLMERYDLRKISILTSFLTTIGCIIKIFSVSPDLYYVVLIGQSFCGVAQVFMMSVPSKLAAVWFGKDEVSTACAIAVFGTQIGVAIGCIVPPNAVHNNDNLDAIGDELFSLNLYNAIVNSALSVLVFLFFEPQPQTPPSQSQAMALAAQEDPDYFQSLKRLVLNRDYLVLLVIFGISNGIWNSFGIVLNTMYLNYFPDAEEDAGLLALIAVISGGCIGSLLFGYILDRTHRFKLTSFTILFLASVAFLVSAFLFEEQMRISIFVSVAFFGFFLAGSLVVGFEFAMELTYPEPEATTLALLNAVILFFGLIFAVVIDALFTSIGYFKTNMCVAIVLCGCAFMVPGISSNLKRVEANKHKD